MAQKKILWRIDNMNTEEIRNVLFGLQDRNYGEFQTKLIPTTDPDTFIGVRTPELRKFASSW